VRAYQALERDRNAHEEAAKRAGAHIEHITGLTKVQRETIANMQQVIDALASAVQLEAGAIAQMNGTA
jgi:predicted  nucleic acid-binding Zn-ribbon protein